MFLKTVWLVLAALIAIFLYTTVWPYINRPPECVEAPEQCKAILEYANTQMAAKYFNFPAEVLNYEINEVMIHKMEEIPGPHNRLRTVATLSGSYTTPPSGKVKHPRTSKFSMKYVFSLGNKYPDGIDVQLIRFP